ncbi:trace amine-associated receptor 1-like [Astyanax mexicanus]|uniref:trace amine-associated receptor 1-like n=1 Tax=Astyanax mexicanus TaxID=7994 RepID=UPI0020CB63B8|nr:trace amine-associated receptor 1-like [Astyanax mexicanus]
MKEAPQVHGYGRDPHFHLLHYKQLDFRMNLSQGELVDITPVCYDFLNGSCPKIVYPLFLKVPLYLFLSSVVILTVFGNLFVIIIIIHFKQLHMPTNYLVLSLAVTDLLLGGILMPPSMVRSVETCWYLGPLFYRYYAVCHPLLYHSKITPFTTLIMIFICWSVSALAGFGTIFLELNILGVEEFYYENVVCEGGCVLFESAAASTASSLLAFYFPGVVMLSIYMKIFRVAQKQAKSIQESKCKNNLKSMLNKEQRKATKTLAVVLGVFLALWTPFFVCYIMNPFISYSVPPVFIEMFAWIGLMNSTCNPIVYAFFYTWFRKAFRVALSGQIFQPGSSRMKLFSN